MTKIFITILMLCIPVLSFSQNSWIRINQLGYNSNSVKVAVFATKENVEVKEFSLVNTFTDEIVFTSQSVKEYGAYGPFNKVFRLNFTEFNQKGSYILKANGIESPVIKIGDNVYEGSADFLLKYLRQQRCGYNAYLGDSCHTHDGFIVDHPTLDSTFIDVTGGWHDASDYLQYVTTSANTVYQMLFAYQQNPTAFRDKFNADGTPGSNGIPDVLDEAKWGLDWLVKMNPRPGMMFNQIADDRDHRKFTLPARDSIDYGMGKGMGRPVYYITGQKQGLAKYKNRSTGVSSSAAKFASSFALGATLLKKHYPDYSQMIAQKAKDAFEFALSDLGVFQTACNVSPYFYEEDNYTDDLELAASALYINTGDSKYLKDASYWGYLEPVTPWMAADTARHYQWYPFVNLGHYYLADSDQQKDKGKFTEFMQRGIESVYSKGKENGFLFGIPFIWCSNNLVAAMLTQLRLYNKITGDTKYLEMEAALRDWLFGCNPWGTTMIVGYPEDADFPDDPHSAMTAAFNIPIDGGLVDGPVFTSIFDRLRGLKIVNGDEYAEFQSDLVVYHDDWGDYSTNEPTMDGTASLTYYFSAMENPAKKTNEVFSNGGTIRKDTTDKNIYLCFTGDEYNDGGEIILNTLKEKNVNANFFFTGKFYGNSDNESLIHNLKNTGNYLGAHSDAHLLYAPWENRDSLLVTKQEFTDDLKANYKKMNTFGISKEQAGVFLPPYEWYNKSISKWTNELGLTLVNFTPGTRSNADYTIPSMGKRYVNSETIYESIIAAERNNTSGLNGYILLLHIGTHPERTDKFYNKLGSLIDELKTKGYNFKTF